MSPPETVSPSQVRACLGLLEDVEEEEEDEPPALSFRIINNYTVASISEVKTHGLQSSRSFFFSKKPTDGAASKKLKTCLPLPLRHIPPWTILTRIYRSQVTVGAIETCIDDVEYALRLMHKASLARQTRAAAQTPEGLSSSFRHWSGPGCSQSDGTVSEASAGHVLLYAARG